MRPNLGAPLQGVENMAVDSDGGEEDGISQRGLTVPGIRKSHKSKSTPDLFHHESSGSSVAGARKLEANKIRDEKNAAAPAKLELPPGLAKVCQSSILSYEPLKPSFVQVLFTRHTTSPLRAMPYS